MQKCVFVCITNNNRYQTEREREVDATQALLESFTLMYYSTIPLQEDNKPHLHNVRFWIIYISPNLRVCSHLGYKVEGVAFYANKLPHKRTTRFYVQ